MFNEEEKVFRVGEPEVKRQADTHASHEKRRTAPHRKAAAHSATLEDFVGCRRTDDGPMQ